MLTAQSLEGNVTTRLQQAAQIYSCKPPAHQLTGYHGNLFIKLYLNPH